MIDMLELKCGNQANPKYVLYEIDQKELDQKRAEARLRICHTVARSTQFQVIVFYSKSIQIQYIFWVCMIAKFKFQHVNHIADRLKKGPPPIFLRTVVLAMHKFYITSTREMIALSPIF